MTLTRESEALLADATMWDWTFADEEVLRRALAAIEAAVRAEQAAEALLAARLGAADPRGYIGYRLGGEQGQTAHDWDYNYQCLRCGRFEHDPGIGEPCTGTGHPMVICCAEHSAELAAAAVADYRSSRRETDR